MRKLHVLFDLMLVAFEKAYREDSGVGMCVYIFRMRRDNLITGEESNEMLNALWDYKPERAAVCGYWWRFGTRGLNKRIEFITRLRDLFKSKNK